MQILTYADDIDIMGKSPKAVKETFLKLEKATHNIALKIYENKTKCIEMTNKLNNDIFILDDKYKSENVKEFKYLDRIVTDENKTGKEIIHRLTLGREDILELRSNSIRDTLVSRQRLNYIKHF